MSVEFVLDNRLTFILTDAVLELKWDAKSGQGTIRIFVCVG